ncbi:MAG: M3 family oligoendopeptidase [Proteobacteria bacterium]|nr:M3 family oligoendopeptidase [Pseudomonadota bacterium]
MLNLPPAFAEVKPPEPHDADVRAAYDGLFTSIDDGSPVDHELLSRWETVRRSVDTWTAWARLRYQQDTRDAGRVADRKRSDEVSTLTTELNAAIKMRLLDPTRRDAAAALVGEGALALWRADCAAFDPAITEALVEESRLTSEYTALLASAEIPFDGEVLDLVTIGKPAVGPDRDTRERASRARWTWFDAHRARLDANFGELVALRDGMAHALGLPDYTELGYLQMQRVDYDRNDVERFRAEVRRRVVPLAARLREEQRQSLGVDTLMSWDEAVDDPAGSPELIGGAEGLAAGGQRAFDGLDDEIAAFYRMMNERGYVDLGARPGKAGGGFCTWLADHKVPFVYCAGNGTDGDVRTLVHEFGHAFQVWSSRNIKLTDTVWPTYEGAEIHSMGLEFLAWPTMDEFFGGEADRFRRGHLVRALCFIPYGVAVDHFQHLVYERPEATPAERHAMWQEMERTYLPWRDYGDMPHASDGGFWQRQRHIFRSPFYYIDYTLAQTCALQLWARSLDDHPGTMAAYRELCTLGGTQPFQSLCASAGLTSPFAEGCLDGVVARAEEWLAR